MKRMSNIKKISLSTVLISILAGCGGGDGSNSSPKTHKDKQITDTQKQTNGYSRALSYDSCVDLNLNVKCENSERGLNPFLYPEIAVTNQENNGKYLLGPAGTDKVSAWTTLVYNEMKYNPLVENNQELAENYLREKFSNNSRSISSSALSVEENDFLENSIQTAIEQNPLVNKNSIIAAVCEKFISSKSFVSINLDDVKKQTRVLHEISFKKEYETDWQDQTTADLVGEIRDRVEAQLVSIHGSERISSISGSSNYLLASSQYHNALTIIDLNENSDKNIKYKRFAAFRTNYNLHQGGIKTAISANGSTDISTGAAQAMPSPIAISGGSGSRSISRSISPNINSLNESTQVSYMANEDPKNTKGLWEHLIEDSQITKDGKTVYTLIKPKGNPAGYSDSQSFGFFKVLVGMYGVYEYNNPTTKRIPSADIKNFQLSHSNEEIVVYGTFTNDLKEEKNVLRTYNKDLVFQKAIEINLLKNFVITHDDKNIIANTNGDYLSSPKLIKNDLKTLVKKSELELPFSPDDIFTYAQGTMAIVTNIAANKILLVNLESMKVEQEKILDIDVNLFAMSNKGSYLAVASKNTINLYNLLTPEITFQASLDVDTTSEKEDSSNDINKLSFVGDSMIAYTQEEKQNALTVYKIIKSKKVMSVDNKLKMALDTLNKYSINNSYDLSQVSQKLNLIPSYKDVNFTWSTSNLSTNINVTNGEITRDTNVNVSGRLTVKASTKFRNDISFAEKTFNLTILKDTSKFSSSANILSSSEESKLNGFTSQVISNSDSSTVITFTRSDSFYKGYNLFQLNNNKLSATQGNENSPSALLRDDLLNMTFKSDNQLIIVTVNKSYPGFSTIYLQDVNYDNTLEEGFNSKQLGGAYIGNNGTPLSAAFSADKTKVLITRQHFDFKHSDFYTDVYAISGYKVKKGQSIKLQSNVSYNTKVSPAVNADGSIFYQIDKNNIYKFENNKVSSLRVDNVTGVYYFNNRVYATNSNGLIISFNEDLDINSKEELFIPSIKNISKLEYKTVNSQDLLYAFADGEKAGIYVIEVDPSNIMKSDSYSLIKNTKGGTVSGDGSHIFAYDNKTYVNSQAPSSSLYYIKK